MVRLPRGAGADSPTPANSEAMAGGSPKNLAKSSPKIVLLV
jgi:hypothetical protein